MDEIEQQLQVLIKKACNLSTNSTERRKTLNHLLQTLSRSGRIWKGWGIYGHEVYQEALQETMIKTVKTLCEKYDPERGGFIPYFNTCLINRCKDEQKKMLTLESRQESSKRQGNDGEIVDLIDGVISPIDAYLLLLIWKAFCQWIETDPDGILQACHVRGTNCQVLARSRIILGKEWKEIATEIGLPRGTLSSHFSKVCRKLLDEWLENNQRLFTEDN